MKILYISGANFPSEVSHTLSKMRMCQALTDAGHDVTLSAFGKSEFESNIIEYYGLKGGFSLNLINIPFWLDNPWLKKIHLHKLVCVAINIPFASDSVFLLSCSLCKFIGFNILNINHKRP